MLRVKAENLRPETRLREDLGADSLDLTEVVMELEVHFGLNLNTREVHISTVAEVVSYMKDSLAARDQAEQDPGPQANV